MLPELFDFPDSISLVSNTGIQFLDFGVHIAPREPSGQFVMLEDTLVTLLAEDDRGYFYSTDNTSSSEHRKSARPHYELSLDESLELLDGEWLPLPFFRYNSSRYEEGPNNWARIRFVKLKEPDFDGNTHRITLAFDTKLMMSNNQTQYLAPTAEDVAAPSIFKMGLGLAEVKWFFDLNWVNNWLKEIYEKAHCNDDAEELKANLKNNHHIAHYLNLLKLLSPIAPHKNYHEPKLSLPEVKLIDQTGKGKSVIPVDLVLDVGNSRTCGILVENHEQASTGLMKNYLLQLRSLSHPEKVYNDAFESRVEFNQAIFGKDNYSRLSGRIDGFLWPTFARVGHEANELASCRQGSEGYTGLSSPKRYLWDKNSYEHGWVFNNGHRGPSNTKAMTAPFASHIDGLGEALYTQEEEDYRLPVMQPAYSRSSLMTFMLAEVISQALCQINSVSQRIRQGLSEHPRRLNSITLTVPPGMPLAERAILNDRLLQALALVWKCLGWHTGDESPYVETSEASYQPPLVPMPIRHVEWDEATCGQLVYLYSEITNAFSHRPEEFFASLGRPDNADKNSITLATIDIGGGTTDLVITRYHLNGEGSNAHIIPTQLFRDGFKLAGDDILLDVIQNYVLPSLAEGLKQAGVAETDALMSKICGTEALSASDSVLRQQLNLQLFTPLGLAILSQYERYNPTQHDHLSGSYTYQDLLPGKGVSAAVQDYVNNLIRRAGGTTPLELMKLPIALDFHRIHQDFLSLQKGFNISQTLSALSEVIFQYNCDKLLLTGRPSRLPGIQALMRQLLPLAPGRILPMHNYRTGSWYPFHKNQRIDDPKTTASVGALLCLLSYESRLQNFFFRAVDLKPYSTIRHFGVIDSSNIITDKDVLFRHIQTEAGERGNEYIKLPEDPATQRPYLLEVRGDLRLGFRQLDSERWTAAPLYTLQLTSECAKKYTTARVNDNSTRDFPVIFVELRVKKMGARSYGNHLISDELEIAEVTSNTDKNFNKRDLKLELNTMLETQSNHNNYWLDSGSVKSS